MKWSTAIAVGLGLLMWTGVSTANAATSDPVDSQPQFVWTADPSPLGVADAVKRSAGSSAAAAAVAAAPKTWAGCGVTADPNKVVRTFPLAKVLRCGNSNYGYWHIFAQHKSQFEQKAAGTYQNWRDIADIGMYASISNSTTTKYRASNDTTCYSRKIYLVNLQNNQTVGSTIVRTVTGNRSNNVITAFPSSGYCTGSE